METTPKNPATGKSRRTTFEASTPLEMRGRPYSRQILRRTIVVSLNRELSCVRLDSCLSGHSHFWLRCSFLPSAAHFHERRTPHPMQHPRRYWISTNCADLPTSLHRRFSRQM